MLVPELPGQDERTVIRQCLHVLSKHPNIQAQATSRHAEGGDGAALLVVAWGWSIDYSQTLCTTALVTTRKKVATLKPAFLHANGTIPAAPPTCSWLVAACLRTTSPWRHSPKSLGLAIFTLKNTHRLHGYPQRKAYSCNRTFGGHGGKRRRCVANEDEDSRDPLEKLPIISHK